jgi:hypothetical protein
MGPGTWEVQWTVKQGKAGSGVIDFLSNNVKVGSGALFKARRSEVQIENGTTTTPVPTITGDTITVGLGSRTKGDEGSAYFNLEYVPFSLDPAVAWDAVESKYFKAPSFSNGVPKWIIRNGVNDELQDGNTDFEGFGTVAGKNGNGAVAFGVDGWDGTGRFVTIGADQAAWSEDKGKTWTTTVMYQPSGLRGLAYGDGVFVAVGYNDTAAWSDDGGETWHLAALPNPSEWYGVAYGDGVFVAIDSIGKAAWSDDGGKIWNAAENDLPPNGDWFGLAYGGEGVFVTVDFHGQAARSDNGGKNWYPVAALPNPSDWYGVAYGDDVFVTLCADTAAWFDDGGKSWNEAARAPASS